MQSASATMFDEAYYQRFYFDKKTSVVDPAHTERLGAFVCSYLQYLRVPVLRVLDVGCGISQPRSSMVWSSAATCASVLGGSVDRWWTTAPTTRPSRLTS